MRRGALFLNLSRGFVVDHRALRTHLESGHLAGAAVDVFPTEPKGRGDEFVSELRGLPNVILTPHIGGSTEEAQQDIGRYVAGKLRDFVAEGSTSMSVNLPHLTLPPRPDGHRIAHLHHNVPGVLASINGTLAEHKVNIEAQLLGTRGHLGYVLTDVAVDYPPEVLDELAATALPRRLATTMCSPTRSSGRRTRPTGPAGSTAVPAVSCGPRRPTRSPRSFDSARRKASLCACRAATPVWSAGRCR